MIAILEHITSLLDVSVLKQYAKLNIPKELKDYNIWMLKQKDKDLLDKWVLYGFISDFPDEIMRNEKIKVLTPKGEKEVKTRYCKESDNAFVDIKVLKKAMEG